MSVTDRAESQDPHASQRRLALGSTPPQTNTVPNTKTFASADRLDPDQANFDNQSPDVGVDPPPQAIGRPTPMSASPADLLDPGQDALADHVPSVGVDPSPQTTSGATPKISPSADLLDPDHAKRDGQYQHVGADSSPQANVPSTPKSHPPADVLDPGQCLSDDHLSVAGVDPLATAQCRLDAQTAPVGGEPPRPPAGHLSADTQTGDASGWLELRIWCEQLEDAMQARIAATNRAERGGVDPIIYQQYIDALAAAEHVCELAMRRCYRRVVPSELVAWQKSERGIGEKLTARLLGHLGDPCIATPHHWEGANSNRVLVADEPYGRTVSQLWQYCGVGDPARRKRKGMTADEAFALGNPTLKMLLHLHAECCVKAGSGTYRDVYDDARETYADRVHAAECVRCGPSGKPAVEGSPWSKGHQHAAALRKVAKEILRDLWRVRHAALRPSINVIAPPIARPSAGNLDSLCPPTIAGPTPIERASAGASEGAAA